MRNPASLSRPKQPARLVPLLLALAVGQAYGATVVTGTPGTAGSNGTAPGAAGTAGSAGQIGTALLGPDLIFGDWTVTGGAGGTGGNGAAGNPGQRGGTAGAGGAGAAGYLQVAGTLAPDIWARVDWQAVGGRGGDAGIAGAPWGLAGPGGAGGNAAVDVDLPALTRNQTIYVQSEGGAGGTGGGVGGAADIRVKVAYGNPASTLTLSAMASGGRGGDSAGIVPAGNGGAATVAMAAGDMSRLGGSHNQIWLLALGGAGGNGRAGANGGAGADTTLAQTLTSPTSGSLFISYGSQGGDGGWTDYGKAGRGGNADTRLTLDGRIASSVETMVSAGGGNAGRATGIGIGAAAGNANAVLDLVANGPVNAVVGAAGGVGGWTGAGTNNATNGGSAAATGSARTSTGDIVLMVTSTGGTGGRSFDPRTSSGNGGNANATAAAYSTSGNITVSVQAAAGMGGEAEVGGGNRAGRGGDATLVNAVSASTSGALSVTQYADAGNGGGAAYGGIAGRGGKAVSILAINDDKASSLTAEVMASGGHQGLSSLGLFDPGPSGGGEASLTLVSTRTGSVASGDVTAWAGGSSNGPGAAAIARGFVQADRSASVEVWAIGNKETEATTADVADALAQARSNGTATALAWAPGRPAYATRARAEAFAGDGPAKATARADHGNADVSAFSSANGTSDNIAWAEYSGQTAKLQAQSRSTGANGVRVTTTADVPAASGRAFAFTSANVGAAVHQPVLDAVQPTAVGSLAVAAPDQAAVTAALAGAPDVAAALARGEVVGMGRMTAWDDGSKTLGAYNYIASANFEFDTAAPGFLTLGLLGPDTDVAGFTSLELTLSNHGTTLFSRSFDSLAAALGFFDDRAVFLGALAAGSQDLLLTADFHMPGATAAGFDFRYALGVSAVPEPQTWLLTLLGLPVLLLRLRRRR